MRAGSLTEHLMFGNKSGSLPIGSERCLRSKILPADASKKYAESDRKTYFWVAVRSPLMAQFCNNDREPMMGKSTCSKRDRLFSQIGNGRWSAEADLGGISRPLERRWHASP